MMAISRPDRWDAVSKTLHWLTVLLILAEVPAGYLMAYTYALSFRDKQGLALHTLASQIHHTNGFLLLTLVCIRLAWRAARTAPHDDEHLGWRRTAARFTHIGLYATLILLPLSGWAALSAFGKAPIWLFNQAHLVPAILPTRPYSDPLGYALYARIHVWLGVAGAAILAPHVGAALWRHFIARDDVLRRMWPLAAPRSLSADASKTVVSEARPEPTAR